MERHGALWRRPLPNREVPSNQPEKHRKALILQLAVHDLCFSSCRYPAIACGGHQRVQESRSITMTTMAAMSNS